MIFTLAFGEFDAAKINSMHVIGQNTLELKQVLVRCGHLRKNVCNILHAED